MGKNELKLGLYNLNCLKGLREISQQDPDNFVLSLFELGAHMASSNVTGKCSVVVTATLARIPLSPFTAGISPAFAPRAHSVTMLSDSKGGPYSTRSGDRWWKVSLVGGDVARPWTQSRSRAWPLRWERRALGGGRLLCRCVAVSQVWFSEKWKWWRRLKRTISHYRFRLLLKDGSFTRCPCLRL